MTVEAAGPALLGPPLSTPAELPAVEHCQEPVVRSYSQRLADAAATALRTTLGQLRGAREVLGRFTVRSCAEVSP